MEMLEQQAAAIGLPPEKVYIPGAPSEVQYERAMKKTLLAFEAQGVTAVAFGALFLEDLKEYREKIMAEAGMEALLPLRNRDIKNCVFLPPSWISGYPHLR
jgi:diphthamide synthase (EF-2-diphthine--ammonia ligase)